MHTIEAAYVFGITLLIIAALVNSTIHLHQKICDYAGVQLEAEIQSHTKDEPKVFRPEDFIRGATLFERNTEDEETGT